MGVSAITSINGMGEVTEPSPGVFATFGMGAEDHMHIANDFLITGGIVKPNDLLVEENGTPDMSVNVNPGTYYVPNSAYTDNSNAQTKFWRGITDNAGGVVNVGISAADGSNPRIDLVCIKVNTAATPDNDGVGVITVVSSADDSALEGTPAASPSAPAVPNDYICIAQVLVGTGVTSIVDANITDRRTVASNNLTVAIKTLADNDPSELDPVFVNIAGVMRKIVAALSVTVNAGTNFFNLANQTKDLQVHLGYRAASGAMFIALSRRILGVLYSDYSSTTTDSNYLPYSGSAPASTDRLVNVGSANVTLGATASFNWSVPASDVVKNGGRMPLPKTQMQEVASTTLGVAGDVITITVPARKYLRIRGSLIPTGGTIAVAMTFNGDTGNNYAAKRSTNFVADADATSASSIFLEVSATAVQKNISCQITNILAQEKQVEGSGRDAGAAGAANVPNIRIVSGKWANTAAQITTMTFTNVGTGDLAVGSEIIVEACD
jgi:hypothetical protein